MSNRLNTQEFIQKAKNVHCDEYDYSKVEYKKSDKNKKIFVKKME